MQQVAASFNYVNVTYFRSGVTLYKWFNLATMISLSRLLNIVAQKYHLYSPRIMYRTVLHIYHAAEEERAYCFDMSVGPFVNFFVSDQKLENTLTYLPKTVYTHSSLVADEPY